MKPISLTLRAFVLIAATSSGILPSLLHAQGQLMRVEEENLVTQAEIYVDMNGREFSRVINVTFAENVISLSGGRAVAQIADVAPKFSGIVSTLQTVARRYGSFHLKKRFEWAEWGRNLKRTVRGKVITLPELSQWFEMRFEEPVPVTSIVELLIQEAGVYAEGPERAWLLSSPNDYSYLQFLSTSDPEAGQWDVSRVDGERAWDISKGSSSIEIAVTEAWSTNTPCVVTALHHDLLGKLDNSAVNNCFSSTDAGSPHSHGISTSGIAGSLTNNASGIASLGWNTQLRGFYWGATGIINAANAGVDVINCSWRAGDSGALDIAVHTALSNGIHVVAGNGNGPDPTTSFNPPVRTYPSGYDYRNARTVNGTFLRSLGNAQVIAVAATEPDDDYLDTCTCIANCGTSNAKFTPDACPYNFSPGTAPITSPGTSFMDVAAPGISTFLLHTTLAGSNTTVRGSGTSFAAPMVSALISLILSVNPALTVEQVHEVLVSTTDKVDAVQYPYNINGLLNQTWNQRLGYGRINAYKALKYTIERYGGTIGGSGETVVFHENINIGSNATLNIRAGTIVRFASGKRLTVDGDLVANGVTFTSDSGTWNGVAFGAGSTGDIRNSIVQAVGSTTAIYVDNASLQIFDSVIGAISGTRPNYGIHADGTSSTVVARRNRIYATYTAIEAFNDAYVSGTNNILVTTSSVGNSVRSYYYGYVSMDAYYAGPVNPNNQSTSSYRAMRLHGNATIDAGSAYSGYNHSCGGSTSFIHARNGSTVFAKDNYWPGVPSGSSIAPYVDFDSSSQLYYPISQGTSSCATSKAGTVIALKSNTGDEVEQDDVRSMFLEAVGLMHDTLDASAVDRAEMLFRNIIARAPYRPEAISALVEISRIYKMNGKDALKHYLIQLSSVPRLRATALGVLVNLYWADEDRAAAVLAAKSLAQEYSGTWHELYAEVSLLKMYLRERQYESASDILAQMHARDESEKEVISAVSDLFEEMIRRERSSADQYWEAAERQEVSALLKAEAYPNPFNPVTTIRYSVSEEAHVIVKVYDMLGREVAELVDKVLERGVYETSFDGSDFASGVYLYRILALNHVASGTIILLK